MKKTKYLLGIFLLIAGFNYCYGERTPSRGTDTTLTNDRVITLNLVTTELLSLEERFGEKESEAKRNYALYKITQSELDSCNQVREGVAFDLNAAQRDNAKLGTENSNLKKGRKALVGWLIGSVTLNAALIIAIVKK